MGQETKAWRNEDEESTGRYTPGEGLVSDESLKAITGDDKKGKPTGQDHSTENYGETEPDHGVGHVQDHSDTSSDIARIKD
jgi:hypothetical protein